MKKGKWLTLVGLAVVIPLMSSYWFQRTHVGSLIETVPNSLEYAQLWQAAIDESDGLVHPAVIHWLPDNCLCRILSSKHASQITHTAEQNGFNVFQINTHDSSLGRSVDIPDMTQMPFSPTIVITHPDGQIAYVGAYSDGVRCNTGNSMVESFIGGPNTLPVQTVVGLDVQTCRCLP